MEILNLDKIVKETQDPTLDPWTKFIYVFCDIDGTELWSYLYDEKSFIYNNSRHDDDDPDICRVGLYAWPVTSEELLRDMEQAITEKKAGNSLCDDEDD